MRGNSGVVAGHAHDRHAPPRGRWRPCQDEDDDPRLDQRLSAPVRTLGGAAPRRDRIAVGGVPPPNVVGVVRVAAAFAGGAVPGGAPGNAVATRGPPRWAVVVSGGLRDDDGGRERFDDPAHGGGLDVVPSNVGLGFVMLHHVQAQRMAIARRDALSQSRLGRGRGSGGPAPPPSARLSLGACWNAWRGTGSGPHRREGWGTHQDPLVGVEPT